MIYHGPIGGHKDDLTEAMWDALDAIWRHRQDEAWTGSAMALERRGLVERYLWGWRLTENGQVLAAKYLGDQPTGWRLRVMP